MKWIGQHIWDLISRFRGKVYIENLEGGTSTTALVVEADGRIKTNSLGSGGGNGEASKVRLPVRFKEAVSKGDPVYIDGYNYGQGTVEVLKAKALISAGAMPSFGLADADYSLNDDGYVITIGNLQDIDTQSFTEGDTLYVASAGGLTKDKPSSETNLIQNVGVVTRAQQNTGQIEVVATGRSNDTPNLDHNNIFIGNSSNVVQTTTLAAAIEGVGNITIGGDLKLDGNTIKSSSGTVMLDTSNSVLKAPENFFTNTVSGYDNTDFELKAGGNIQFTLDIDNNETAQSFSFRDGGAYGSFTEIANLSQSGVMTMYGSQLGQPAITLQQNTQTAAYGPPVFEFFRNSINTDDSDIGRLDFNARDSGGSETVYARILARTEETAAGNEGGQLRLQVASHDGEIVTGLKIEDGNAEDEVDVTIGNGSASNINIPGALNVTGSSYFGSTPIFAQGLDVGSSDTTITRTAAGEVSIEGKKIVTENYVKHVLNCGWYGSSTSRQYLPFGYGGTYEATSPNGYLEYGAFIAPCNGEVESVIIRSEIPCGNSTVGIHIAQNGVEMPSFTPGTGVSDTVYMADDDTSYKFENFDGQYADDLNTFNAGDIIVVSFDPTNVSQDSVATMVLNLDWTNSL